jgi:cyclopropane-fatty-acyl-phospholipid synthase
MRSMPAVSAAGANRLHAALSHLLGTEAWDLHLWDGSETGMRSAPRFTVSLRSRRALDALIGGLPERAFGRAYVSGDLDVEPLQEFLEAIARTSVMQRALGWPRIIPAALALGARPSKGAAGDAEARLKGRLHSRERDAAAVHHHYNLPPEFFALFLDSTMTYTCGYFETEDTDLDTAQVAKLDLVCRKLRLQPGEKLLDIGCGWGSLIFHAVEHYGARGVGITLSQPQLETAQRHAEERGLGRRAEFRLLDYRDIAAEGFDAVASVGMIEQVGRKLLRTYAGSIHRALRPGGRALVHGITCKPETGLNRAGFINTFVFPDGELEDVSAVTKALEVAGLEVRDTENLREHYVLTLRNWIARLEKNWDAAVRLAGLRRARVWRLYMSGSSVSFRIGAVAIHQTVAVRNQADGASGMPLTRADWYTGSAKTAAARRSAAAAAVAAETPAPETATLRR